MRPAISRSYATFFFVLSFCACLISSIRVGGPALHHANPCITYTSKVGDTCKTISESHHILMGRFESWNPTIECYSSNSNRSSYKLLTEGQTLCIPSPLVNRFANLASSHKSPSNRPVFREYIGAIFNGVTFDDVPINPDVEFHFILAFALDYSPDASIPTNGHFYVNWDEDHLNPNTVESIKNKHSNVRVLLSLGGDTLNNGHKAQFNPSSVSSWVDNAVSSLTSIINHFHLDGIDIDYEHFDESNKQDFASCIGELIFNLKKQNTISIASIAPYDELGPYYTYLWEKYNNIIDYVNFQFYTYDRDTSPSQFVKYYNKVASTYEGGKIMASFSTEHHVGVDPENALLGCKILKANGNLPGIFIFSADDSYASDAKFKYEQEAQTILIQ